MDGFLGTSAGTASDLTLVAYLVLIVPAMLVGFVFARRKMFRPYHKITMTAITLVNWAIILLLMAKRYNEGVVPGLSQSLAEPPILFPSIHLVFGGLAQLTATYLVILMWTEKTRFEWIIPAALRLRNIKRYMRMTLALWLITAALGATTYFTWYVNPPSAADSPSPAATTDDSLAPAETPQVTPEVESGG